MKYITKEKKVLEELSDIYILIILIVFPLIVDKTGFFHILECKWYSYIIISSIYIISSIAVLLYFRLIQKTKLLMLNKLTKIQCLSIIFLFVNIISFFISPFRKNYNLLIGTGRGEGLIVSTLYIISFLFLSLYTKFKKKYITYFSISSIFLNFIAILQFIGFNPFYMYQDGIGIHNVSFLTTIGNIDFVSALYCILISISFSAFIFLEKQTLTEKIVHLLSILMAFMMIAIMGVASGKLAPFLTLVIIFPFIIINNRRFSRFLIAFSTILMSYCLNLFINPQYYYEKQKIGITLNFNYIIILFLLVCAVLLYLSYIVWKTKYDYSSNKKIIKYIYLSIIGIIITGIIFLYFYKSNIEMLSEIHELLHGNFDDKFGTYRIFLWKRTLSIIPQYLLLGSGPDTFAIRFMAKYTQDIAALGELTINDTAANIYLTMTVNLGLIGLITYLSFLYNQIKIGIKRINKYSMILLIAIVCYSIQAFFNLSVVIVSPIFWTLLALHYSSIYNTQE